MPSSWRHVAPAALVTCRTDFVRRLAQNIVRYLYITGNYDSALESADKALEQWTADSGQDNQYVLIMARLKAQVLRAIGRYHEAYELADETFQRMRRVLGDDHEETLILMNGLCVDLRARGDFKGSLALTKASLERHRLVFGDEHPRTLAAMNNLAEDLELNSDYVAARKLHEKLYEEKLVVYLSDSHPVVLLTLNALARVMREEGNFLKLARTPGVLMTDTGIWSGNVYFLRGIHGCYSKLSISPLHCARQGPILSLSNSPRMHMIDTGERLALIMPLPLQLLSISRTPSESQVTSKVPGSCCLDRKTVQFCL